MEVLFDWVVNKCEEYLENQLFIDSKSRAVSYGEFSLCLKETLSFYKTESIENESFSIISVNSVQYLSTLLALQKMGNVAVNLNPNLTSKEICDRLEIAKVSVVFTNESIFKVLKVGLEKHGIRKVYLINDDATSFTRPESIVLKPKKTAVDHNFNSLAFLQFTGGTSGVLKAASLTHQNVLANVEQLHTHFNQYIDLEGLKVIIVFPFYHVFSLVFNFMFFVRHGGCCIINADLRNIDLIIDLIHEQKPNFIVGVNTWYKKLMQNKRFEQIKENIFRVCLAGGEFVPLSTKYKWREKTGHTLYSAYGLTETSSLAIVSELNSDNIDDSIGVAIPGTQIKLYDSVNREITKFNELGEITIRGPQLTSEYFNNEKETTDAFIDGWFKTGDIAVKLNERTFKIVDRKKDMISVSGNKVYPNEVEEVLLKLPCIIDAAVVGKFSQKTGEEVVACLVLDNIVKCSDQNIMNHCKKFLSRFKVPKIIYRYQELPKTPIGKTARIELRKQINRN